MANYMVFGCFWMFLVVFGGFWDVFGMFLGCFWDVFGMFSDMFDGYVNMSTLRWLVETNGF